MVRLHIIILFCASGFVLGCGEDPRAPAGVGGTSGNTSGTGGGGDVSETPDSTTGLVDLGFLDVPDIGTPGGDDPGNQSDSTVDPADAASEPGKLGFPCAKNDECDADWCVETPTGNQCSELCIDSCTKEGWGCKNAQTLGGDPVLICLPLFPHLCEPCTQDSQCTVGVGDGGDKCVPLSDELGSFCGGDCSTGVSCPEGYECEAIDFGAGVGLRKQCMPTSNECVCTEQAIAIAATTECRYTNDHGSCVGTRSCGPDGLTDCSAPTPAEEVCDGKDNNCDGDADEADSDGCIVYFLDLDGDGFGDGADSKCLCAPDAQYKAVEAGDCDDLKIAINPGASELCNSIDDDCDNEIDEVDALGCKDYWADADVDGWGDEFDKICLCVPEIPYVSQKPGDCDDADQDTWPAAPETCSGKDTNCDGQVAPEGTPGCQDYFLDSDQDGFGVAGDKKCLCAPEGTYSTQELGDCDDVLPQIKPGAIEACDTVDNNCDGTIDEADATGCENYYKDNDLDNFGDPLDSQCLCAASGSYTSLVAEDCDDGKKAVNPSAEESCNDQDDDCDGDTDEQDASGCNLYFEDKDQDGYGIDETACLCAPTTPFTATQPGDCDDDIDELAPDKPEACGDQADNNCNGQIDEEDGEGCFIFFQDGDGDGYGTSQFKCLCEATGTFTGIVGGDCADNDAFVFPQASELCDAGIDNDCDGETDEEGASGCDIFFEDLDKDGFGVAGSSKCLCEATLPYLASVSGDCKDGNEDINPNATEVCGDAVDNNCNGAADEEGASGCTPFFQDADGDTFGLLGTDKCLCGVDGQWSATKAGDCDDTPQGVLIFPGAQCVAPSCTGFLLTQPTICAGSGDCEGGITAPCPDGFVCSEDGVSCRTTCAADGDCINGNFCVAGACSGKKADGTQCFDGTQCLTGYCNNGFCCDDTAGDGSTVCCGGSDTHCDDDNVCTNDSCGAGFSCEASDNNGETCAEGFCDGSNWAFPRTCAGGTCAPAGNVEACSSGNPCEAGTCTVSGCADDDPLTPCGCSSVDLTAGTPCSSPTCDGFTLTTSATCDGSGTCLATPASFACVGGYQCASPTGCGTSCAVVADCQPGFYCEDTFCLKEKTDGSPCTDDSQCSDGSQCNGGFCCAGDQCCTASSHCNDTNVCTQDVCLPSFVCTNPNNSAVCATGSCTLDGSVHTLPRVCQNGACPAVALTEACIPAIPNPCILYDCTPNECSQTALPSGVTCQEASCTGSTLTSAMRCDGAGSCSLGGAPSQCAGGLACDQGGGSCKLNCVVDSDCDDGRFCSEGVCLPNKGDGTACLEDNQCASGYCGSGFCCEDSSGIGATICCGSADNCDDGNACTNDICTGASKCAATLVPNGTDCTEDECLGLEYQTSFTCLAGQCTGGGQLLNCVLLESACWIFSCDDTDPAPISGDGCQGSPAASGTNCEPQACVGAHTLRSPRSCDGLGSCNTFVDADCPGGYVCSNATDCATSCAADTDCQGAFYCTAAGSCQPRKAAGEACTGDADNQCVFGLHCENGFCCGGVGTAQCCSADLDCADDNPCTLPTCGAAKICNLFNQAPAGTICEAGFCDASGDFHPAKQCNGNQCTIEPPALGCTGADSCLEYSCDDPPPGQLTGGGCSETSAAPFTPCGDATCAGSAAAGYIQTSSALCDGLGGCSQGASQVSCGPYSCDGTACRSICQDDTNCVDGFFCGGGFCVPVRADGETCSGTTAADANAQCLSGFCGGGFCCSGSGDDQCCADTNDCIFACTSEGCDTCTSAACNANQCNFTFQNNAICVPAACDGFVHQPSRLCSNGECLSFASNVDCGPDPADPSAKCKVYECLDNDSQCSAEIPVAEGTPCGDPPLCSNGQRTTAALCGSTGVCNSPVTAACPGGYECSSATECRTDCSDDAHCQSGFGCTGGVCSTLRQNGEPCAASTQCQSDYCANGFCCAGAGSPLCCNNATACPATEIPSGQVSSCAQAACVASACTTEAVPNAGTLCADAFCDGDTGVFMKWCQDGACTPSSGDIACSASPTEPQCDYTQCSLTSPPTGNPQPQCVQVSTTGTPCGPGSCTNGSLTTSVVCNGNECSGAGAGSGPCAGGFGCLDGTSCRTICSTDAHCQDAFYCESGECKARKSAGQVCVPGECSTGLACANGYCCDDSNAECCQLAEHCTTHPICQTAACTNNGCVLTPASGECSGGSCSAIGDQFTPPKTCVVGACVQSAATQACEENLGVCYDYTCDPATGCVATPLGQSVEYAPASCTGNQYTAKLCDGFGNVADETVPCSASLTCNALGTGCLQSCSGNSDCVADHFCLAGECLPELGPGETCTTNAQCSTSYCNSGICCGGGTCCTANAQCDDPAQPCMAGQCTNNSCGLAALPNDPATTCVAPTCSGTDYTGPSLCVSGTCIADPFGTQDCSGANECLTYWCNDQSAFGQLGCRTTPKVSGFSCQQPSCSNGQVTPRFCNGAGTCQDGGTSACGGNFACNAIGNACLTACANSDGCQGGYFCRTADATCQPQKESGQTCANSDQCQAGYCSNGFCCGNDGSDPSCCAANNDCPGGAPFCQVRVCEQNRCILVDDPVECLGAACVSVDGALSYREVTFCDSAACTDGGITTDCSGGAVPDPCFAYTCDEAIGGCVQTVLTGTTCSGALCAITNDGGNISATVIPAGQCSAAGSCSPPSGAAACPGGYLCADATSCRTGCDDDSHCDSDFYCSGGGGVCLPKKSDGFNGCTGNNTCLSSYCDNFICCTPGPTGTCCNNDITCGGSDACTTRSCVSNTCVETLEADGTTCASAACVDSTTAQSEATCAAGACTGGADLSSCVDAESCTTDSCVGSGVCAHTNTAVGTTCAFAGNVEACSGSIFLAQAVCDGLGVCADPVQTECDDAAFCNGPETCDLGSPSKCAAGANPTTCGDNSCDLACEDATGCPTDCACSPAYTLSNGEIDRAGTSATGSTDRLESYGSCTGSYTGSEYVYTWHAASSGKIEARLEGADSSTDLLVIPDNNSGCDPEACVAVAAGTGATVQWDAVAGTDYHLVVDRRAPGATDFEVYVREADSCDTPFQEDWDRLPFPRAWTVDPGNWVVASDSPFGESHAKFSGTPLLSGAFDKRLTSPVFDTSKSQGVCGVPNLTISWRVVLAGVATGADVMLHVEGSADGGSNYTEIFSYDLSLGQQIPITDTMPAAILANTTQARIRIRATGSTTVDLSKIQIDDIIVDAP